MSDKIWKKFRAIFKDFENNFNNFENFGDSLDGINDITDHFKKSTPEEFMGGQEFTKTEEEGIDSKTGETYTKTTYMSKDGKRKFTRKVVNAKPIPNNFSDNIRNQSMQRSNRLYTLEMDLKIAIEKQEFEKAAKMRDEIAKLKEQLKKAK